MTLIFLFLFAIFLINKSVSVNPVYHNKAINLFDKIDEAVRSNQTNTLLDYFDPSFHFDTCGIRLNRWKFVNFLLESPYYQAPVKMVSWEYRFGLKLRISENDLVDLEYWTRFTNKAGDQVMMRGELYQYKCIF